MLRVIVCTYRRFDCLGQCLGALAAQTLDKGRFRVVVVDNSLMPEQSAAFRDGVAHLDLRLDYRITERSGLSHARNVGLADCDEPIVAFLDDDAFAAADWAANLLDVFARHGERLGAVGGRALPVWEVPRPAWLDDRFLGPLGVLDWGEEERPITPLMWLIGANMAFRTEALRAAGGFPEHLGRNRDLLLSHEELAVVEGIRSQGHLVLYAPQVAVGHFMQRERIDPAWFYRYNYWDAVSRVLRAGNVAGLDGVSLKSQLADQLDDLLAAVGPTDEPSQIRRHCDDFFTRGGLAFKKAFGHRIGATVPSPTSHRADIRIPFPAETPAMSLTGSYTADARYRFDGSGAAKRLALPTDLADADAEVVDLRARLDEPPVPRPFIEELLQHGARPMHARLVVAVNGLTPGLVIVVATDSFGPMLTVPLPDLFDGRDHDYRVLVDGTAGRLALARDGVHLGGAEFLPLKLAPSADLWLGSRLLHGEIGPVTVAPLPSSGDDREFPG